MSLIFDLFGDPVPEGWGKRGRPQHIATLENRNKVNMLLALGWNNERISKALGITPPTLRKNYFRELKFRADQRDRMDSCLAMLLWKECQAGNVAAMKEFARLVERNDTMGAQADFAAYREPAPVAEKIGKKEMAEREAQTAGDGTDWGGDLLTAAPTVQ